MMLTQREQRELAELENCVLEEDPTFAAQFERFVRLPPPSPPRPRVFWWLRALGHRRHGQTPPSLS